MATVSASQGMTNIESVDSDGDGFTNIDEINARTFPGDPASHPIPVDTSQPSVTINQAAGQADPTSTSPINFAVVFNESVTGFATGDVTLSGTAGATTATVTGSGITYNVAVTGMSTNGTVIATIGANVAQDTASNNNTASTSTDNTVTYTITISPPTDTSRPSVTINQAAGQADPTSTSPINFAVVFNESVTGFATGDVTLSGTAGATTATVTGSGTTYNVAVTGMSTNGTVIATIGANVAQDTASNNNTASTSTDNTVTYTIATTSDYYMVTFIVTDNVTGKPIKDAKVSIDGVKKETNRSGMVVFKKVSPGTHSYSIKAEHYKKSNGSIEVSANMTISVKLINNKEKHDKKDDNKHDEKHDIESGEGDN